MEHFYQTIDGWFDFQTVYDFAVSGFKHDFGHFVEIGCWQGKSSSYLAVNIINSEKNIKFDCVDTWEGSIEHQEQELVKSNKLFDVFTKNMEPVKGYYNAIKKPSVEAAKLYEDKSLDFVFVDASHEFEPVYEDLTAWYPKVKDGAIIAGHDYYPPPNENDVHRAANKFFREKNKQIYVVGMSFLVIK
ncbi:MAG: class I SAM-dependent methyltransferase [Betaproteobacteria bacterium]|nr:class I SAM-dependent methyltransferase [Betaproteobacteria bacterium]